MVLLIFPSFFSALAADKENSNQNQRDRQGQNQSQKQSNGEVAAPPEPAQPQNRQKEAAEPDEQEEQKGQAEQKEADKQSAPDEQKVDGKAGILEKIEITRKGDHIVIKTEIDEIDLRPALDSLFSFGRKKGQGEGAPAPVKPPPSGDAQAEPGRQRLLDVYVGIKKILLPNGVLVEDTQAFFVYGDNKGVAGDIGVLSFIESLSSAPQKDLLFGLQNLDFDGTIRSDGKPASINVKIAPLDDKTKSVLVRSGDASAMMKVLGLKNIEGDDYILSAQWQQEQGQWVVSGWIELRDFYIVSPPAFARLIGGVFSFRGFFSALTSKKVFFKKVRFPFNMVKGKSNFDCQIFFGETRAVPCGNFTK